MTTGLQPRSLGLPSHWRSCQLRRIAAIENGADYKTFEVDSGGVPVLGSGGEFARAKRAIYGGPSVLFGRKGTIDKPLLVTEPFWTADTMFYTRLMGNVEPRFLYYYATTIPFRFYSTDTALPSMTSSDLAGHEVPLPPLREQAAIADFLDRETARIDTLIEKQEKLIETLRERVQANVVKLFPPPEATTEQLDRLGRHARIGNGSTPQRGNPSYWDHGNIPWLNSSAVNRASVTEAQQFVTETAFKECHLPLVRPGSSLVGLTGQGKTRGMTTHLSMTATINQHMAFLTPDPAVLDSWFLTWTLRARYDGLRRLSDENGSTRGGLTCQQIAALPIRIPPINQQKRTVYELEVATQKTETLITKAERFIELAKERRSALITAAVTGQIEVGEEAPVG